MIYALLPLVVTVLVMLPERRIAWSSQFFTEAFVALLASSVTSFSLWMLA